MPSMRQSLSLYKKNCDAETAVLWSHWPGSNRPPARYECAALPDELQWQIWKSITVFYYVLKATSRRQCKFYDTSAAQISCPASHWERHFTGGQLQTANQYTFQCLICLHHDPEHHHAHAIVQKSLRSGFFVTVSSSWISCCVFLFIVANIYTIFSLPRLHIAQIYHMQIVFYNRNIYQFAHIFCLHISQTSTPAKIHVHNFA